MTYIAEHYQSLLGLSPPWQVSEVVVRHETEEVEVVVEWRGERPACPECGAAGQRHDGRRRRWRHLDTMQYRTWLVAQLPRVRCAAHGVRQVSPPWAEEKSRFTARFEGLVIAWLLEASALAVGRQFGLSWGRWRTSSAGRFGAGWHAGSSSRRVGWGWMRRPSRSGTSM